MLEEDPKISKFEKHIKFMQFALNESASDRQEKGVKVAVYYGDSGTGKTYSAINLYAPDGDYFKLDCTSVKSGSLWFDGYEGQRVLILDDFDADVCSISFLKNLLDKYKLRLQVKGGHTWACWSTVVITSNQHPRYWWQALQQVQIDALKRRIHEIRHYTGLATYVLEEWNTDPIGEPVNEFKAPAPVAAPVILAADTEDQQPAPAPAIDIANADTEPLIYGTPTQDMPADPDIVQISRDEFMAGQLNNHDPYDSDEDFQWQDIPDNALSDDDQDM